MGEIYVIHEDGSSTAVESIFCKDEARELQRIIEVNPNLIPGDQIDPDNPRSWLMIRREMPVPDPSNGENRWSIDFFFADQDAIPTFVECKRHNDTRARREVVGQMLEYVANGHYYWTAAQLTSFAEESATKRNTSLDAVVAAIQGPGGHPQVQQVSGKTACKNAEFRKWSDARSTGRNEKPRTDWRLVGSCVQSETGFANVIGGESGILNVGTGFSIPEHLQFPTRHKPAWLMTADRHTTDWLEIMCQCLERPNCGHRWMRSL